MSLLNKLIIERGHNMNYLEKYNQWIENEYFDEATRQELIDLKGNDEEVKDRFYKDLEFGTAGLRGILGAGSNRINIYTVRKATQGIANYINKQGGQERGVAIAYDSRRLSPELANEAALCFNANGIKTYMFEALRPVPELSFAVRQLSCIAGVVITASHNPPEYNGYKVYWEDGAQITAPKDEEIIAEVNAVSDYSTVKTMDLALAKKQELNHVIGKEIDDKYITEIKKYILNPLSNIGKKLKIVYTPIHGSGITLVPRILKELGFENVYIVKEQEEPDFNFPTVSYPNPEDPEVYELALKLAKKVDADIILATDPDADRIGIQVKNTEGEYKLFSGNMIGEIMLEYILSQRKAKGTLPTNGAIVKTVVSSNMVDKMAEEYNAELFEVLTGFKYIGEKIKEFRASGSHEYLFGFEESYGFLIGTYARDKDAVSAVMVLCEAAAYYKDQGFTLNEQIDNIRRKYGYFHEDVFSATFKGISGMEKMKEIMKSYREDVPSQIGEFKVIKVRDYLQETISNLETNEVKPSFLPKSDVLYFELEDDAWCAVRPSGTEPKIKIYFGVKGANKEDADKKIQSLMSDPVFEIEE